jgi:hypothetical protein
MATPVEISFVKMGDGHLAHRIEGLGGLFRDRPWYLCENSLIAEAEKPDATRVWDFYLLNGAETVPLIVAVRGGRKYLATPGESAPSARLVALPPLPPAWERRCA